MGAQEKQQKHSVFLQRENRGSLELFFTQIQLIWAKNSVGRFRTSRRPPATKPTKSQLGSPSLGQAVSMVTIAFGPLLCPGASPLAAQAAKHGGAPKGGGEVVVCSFSPKLEYCLIGMMRTAWKHLPLGREIFSSIARQVA